MTALTFNPAPVYICESVGFVGHMDDTLIFTSTSPGSTFQGGGAQCKVRLGWLVGLVTCIILLGYTYYALPKPCSADTDQGLFRCARAANEPAN